MISKRRGLARALELAREAVELDTKAENVQATLEMYAKSVSLLSEVIEEVQRDQRDQRQSEENNEEELKKLAAIHDSYRDRMLLLSIVSGIPLSEVCEKAGKSA